MREFNNELAGKYYPLNDLSEADRKQLKQDNFLFSEGNKYLEAAGFNYDWPNGRGVFLSHDKTFLIWVNEEDHLRFISMQPNGDIHSVFSKLCKACTILEKYVSFSFSDRLGFITSCPSNLGTSLRASIYIKLPKLGKRKEEF